MTMTARRNRPVYEATLYHDSPDNAADDSRHLGYFPSRFSAVKAINAERTPADGADAGWFTGGIRYGFLWEAVFGQSPEYFESDDRETPWFVGIDGKAVR